MFDLSFNVHCPLQLKHPMQITELNAASPWPCTMTSVVKCIPISVWAGSYNKGGSSQLHTQNHNHSDGSTLNEYRGLTVTLRFAPNVLHVAVQQVDQHQTVTAQEAVPAARITRTHLRTHGQYWTCHSHAFVLLTKTAQTNMWLSFLLIASQADASPAVSHATRLVTLEITAHKRGSSSWCRQAV